MAREPLDDEKAFNYYSVTLTREIPCCFLSNSDCRNLVCLLYTLHALLWINDPQAFDNPEITVVRLGNVHVHPNVMLTGHHFRWTTRPRSDLCVL